MSAVNLITPDRRDEEKIFMQDIDLRKYPSSSGVYLMKGKEGDVLYVGKAKNIRARLRSYTSLTGDGRAHIRFLMQKVHLVEVIVTDTEKEALILENNLIKRHRPRYNINLRDDKTYVSIRLDIREEFPWLKVVRKVKQDGALYFGPYASAGAVRETIREIYRIFPLRRYPMEYCRRRGRPCLYYQIDQCSAPCYGKISQENYRVLVKGVIDLLSGREKDVLNDLRKRMAHAAEEMRFEDAARLRDQIQAIEQTVEHQKVVEAGGGDQDVIGFYREGEKVEIAILFVRQGKLIGRRSYAHEWRLEDEELLSSFLHEFYERDVLIPHEILLSFLPEDAETLSEWLSERRGKKVYLQAPKRGKKLALVRLAERNAEESYRERGNRSESMEAVLADIQTRLHLRRLPRRMECFDVSTTYGTQTVGSMVTFVDGEPDKDLYRRFRIRTVEGMDDFACLYEVLMRRLTLGKKNDDLPDFILMDGGKGQLSMLTMALKKLNLSERIDAAGIAKARAVGEVQEDGVDRREERFYLPGRKNPVILPHGAALHMLMRLRDEAHRFAITYHRDLRKKAVLRSSLEDIPGIGPERRKALLRHFGSLKRIREASLEDLLAAPGIPEPLARRIFEYYQD